MQQWKKIANAAQKKVSDLKKSRERKQQEKKSKIQQKTYSEILTPKKNDAKKMTKFPNPLYNGGQEPGSSVKTSTPAEIILPRDLCNEIVQEILEVIFCDFYLVVFNYYLFK